MSSTEQLHQQAQLAVNRRDYQAAHALCVRIVQQQPDHADAYFLLGIINSEVGQIAKAIKLMEKAISLSPNVEYSAYLAKCLSLRGEMQAALAAIEQAPVDRVNQPKVLDTLGVALSRVGHHEEALRYFGKALTLCSDEPQIHYNYAVSSKFAGQFEQARLAFENAISLKPDYYQAHFALSDLGGTNQEHNHIDRLLALKANKPDVDSAIHLAHALAKEYESVGDYSRAFTELATAKAAKRTAVNYHFEQDAELFSETHRAAKAFLPNQTGGCNSERPIFVMGMPRSGTTLVERIISAHSDVASGGELQDFGVAVKELAGTASNRVLDLETLRAASALNMQQLGQRYIERTAFIGAQQPKFIDKLPFNFFYLHLIRQALPNAKIICLLRDPMDTCVGNFRQLFSLNSPYYQYAYDLCDTGRFYMAFRQLADIWHQHGDENVRFENYEALVRDPQKHIPELIDFCGLQWQEACLYAERNQAPVSTASKVQVREPINTRSIGRWKRYQPHTDKLEDLIDAAGLDD